MAVSTEYFLYDMSFYSQSTLLYVLLYHLLNYTSCVVSATSHIDLGVQFLAKGQIGEALNHFHSAVEDQPDNFMPYYRRATAYLALGKGKAALSDLNKVIELRPDFQSARSQRGGIYLKFGDFGSAEEDFIFLQNHGKESEAPELADKLGLIMELKSLSEELHSVYYHDQDYETAIPLLEKIIDSSPWNTEYREMRAECFVAIDEPSKAIFDLKQLTKLINDNTGGFLKISLLYYQLADDEQSLVEIRECLKLDPDHKDCFSHYKKVKKLSKQLNDAQDLLTNGQYTEALAKFESALKTEPKVEAFRARILPKRCKCLSKNQDLDDAIRVCSQAAERNPDDAEILADRAEAFLVQEEFEKAISDYEKAVELDSENRSYQKGLEKAKRLLKQSQRRDYYKILGVKRTANKREINKAYRQLAQEWHPDNFHTEKEKEEAEKKFMDIAAAKEVLSDPEMREKFDNGEDPLDPEQQKQQGFNPFQGGGFPFNFQGGSFKFKF